MAHSMFRLLTTQPDLLAGLLGEHAAAYAQLASAEAAQAAAHLRTRTMWQVLGIALALATVVLAGVALLLLAALPLQAMPAPWLLATVPLLTLAAAFGCWLRLQRLPWSSSFTNLRQQLAADAALLRASAEG